MRFDFEQRIQAQECPVLEGGGSQKQRKKHEHACELEKRKKWACS